MDIRNNFLRVPLSSTPPLSSTHQLNTKGPLLFSAENSLLPHRKPISSTQGGVWGFGVELKVFAVELRRVELRDFWCVTEGIFNLRTFLTLKMLVKILGFYGFLTIGIFTGFYENPRDFWRIFGIRVF